jgi:hypothetical protein
MQLPTFLAVPRLLGADVFFSTADFLPAAGFLEGAFFAVAVVDFFALGFLAAVFGAAAAGSAFLVTRPLAVLEVFGLDAVADFCVAFGLPAAFAAEVLVVALGFTAGLF